MLSGKVITVHRGACHVALDKGSTIFKYRVLRYACGAPHFGRAGAEVSRYLFDCRGAVFLFSQVEEKAASSATGGRMNSDDPIIAAIEAHRRACADTCAAYERQSAVENELVAGVRVPAGAAENDLQWIAASDAAGEALAVQDELALKLLETQPTTIAGAAALLTYYVDAVTTTQPEVVFPELDGNGRPFESKLIEEPRRDFAYFIVRNVATALSNMAAAGDAIEQHGASELPTGLEHRVLVGAAE
jgi:hypothetical protein